VWEVEARDGYRTIKQEDLQTLPYPFRVPRHLHTTSADSNDKSVQELLLQLSTRYYRLRSSLIPSSSPSPERNDEEPLEVRRPVGRVFTAGGLRDTRK
jgi:hypothetical protein